MGLCDEGRENLGERIFAGARALGAAAGGERLDVEFVLTIPDTALPGCAKFGQLLQKTSLSYILTLPFD